MLSQEQCQLFLSILEHFTQTVMRTCSCTEYSGKYTAVHRFRDLNAKVFNNLWIFSNFHNYSGQNNKIYIIFILIFHGKMFER